MTRDLIKIELDWIYKKKTEKNKQTGGLFQRFGNVAFEYGSILRPLQHNAVKVSSGFCRRCSRRRFRGLFLKAVFVDKTRIFLD